MDNAGHGSTLEEGDFARVEDKLLLGEGKDELDLRGKGNVEEDGMVLKDLPLNTEAEDLLFCNFSKDGIKLDDELQPAGSRIVYRIKPPINTYKLNVKGIFNQQCSGYGGILRDNYCNIVMAFASPLPLRDENFDVLLAILYGIKLCISLGTHSALILEGKLDQQTRLCPQCAAAVADLCIRTSGFQRYQNESQKRQTCPPADLSVNAGEVELGQELDQVLVQVELPPLLPLPLPVLDGGECCGGCGRSCWRRMLEDRSTSSLASQLKIGYTRTEYAGFTDVD
ncbi:hypothetical protein M5K25_002517 [Dendrobium thyrsiflorum]|uniref:Uncharacterized protein n=1 Tax=Dendrobium thyrsiflorum TaxID=117978 RepID=A0ABD0VNG3_DENTH